MAIVHGRVVNGEEYTLNGEAYDEPFRATVYVDEDDPNRALVDRPDRWVYIVSVLAWFAAAAVVLSLGALRRVGKKREREARNQQPFGNGLGQDWMEHHRGRSP